MALRSTRRFMSKSSIQSGMLLDITYKKGSGETKTYSVLAIDPDKVNQHTNNRQLHGLLIDDLSDDDVIKLINVMGELTYDAEDKRAPLTDLQNNEAYEKFKANYDTKERYRTFILENITNVRQILIGEVG
jgi:peroxiredoxin